MNKITFIKNAKVYVESIKNNIKLAKICLKNENETNEEKYNNDYKQQ